MSEIREKVARAIFESQGVMDRCDEDRAWSYPAADAALLACGYEKMRGALKELAAHCNDMEAQNRDYHDLQEDGQPCISRPLANAYAVLSQPLREALSEALRSALVEDKT